MSELNFAPICLKSEGNRTRLISTVEQALHALERHWPNDDPARQRAVRVCQMVFEGRAAPSAAHDALIRAASRAGIYIPFTVVDRDHSPQER